MSFWEKILTEKRNGDKKDLMNSGKYVHKISAEILKNMEVNHENRA